MARAIDWTHYDALKAQGLADREIARQWGIPWTTFHRGKQRYTADHSSIPAIRPRNTRAHPSTPIADHTEAHSGTPTLLAQQHTPVHLSTPLSNDVAMRLLSLLPDLEVMVARERDRQRLLSTPSGTPRHTIKKTYVIDTLYVDLIDRYAQAEGVELKDVVNLAFHEFFERRQYLPGEEDARPSR
jgi:hypothetical protein